VVMSPCRSTREAVAVLMVCPPPHPTAAAAVQCEDDEDDSLSPSSSSSKAAIALKGLLWGLSQVDDPKQGLQQQKGQGQQGRPAPLHLVEVGRAHCKGYRP